jgi:copper chaperone
MLDLAIVGGFKVHLSIQRQEFQMIAFEVNDMTCGHCVSAITKAVKQVDAAAQVSVDLPTKRVEINSSVADGAALQAAIQEAGYSPRTAPAASSAAPQRARGGCCGGH